MKKEKKTFEKMTKKERLKMPIVDSQRMSVLKTEAIDKLVFIPITKKMSGYGMSAVFVESRLGWDRLNDYDCFKISVTDTGYKNHVRGDFQYGGVVFFLEKGSLDRFTNEFIKSLAPNPKT